MLLASPRRDRIFPYERYGRPLREALPFAGLRMLDDVGHIPMLDDAARVAALIRDCAGQAEQAPPLGWGSAPA